MGTPTPGRPQPLMMHLRFSFSLEDMNQGIEIGNDKDSNETIQKGLVSHSLAASVIPPCTMARQARFRIIMSDVKKLERPEGTYMLVRIALA